MRTSSGATSTSRQLWVAEVGDCRLPGVAAITDGSRAGLCSGRMGYSSSRRSWFTALRSILPFVAQELPRALMQKAEEVAVRAWASPYFVSTRTRKIEATAAALPATRLSTGRRDQSCGSGRAFVSSATKSGCGKLGIARTKSPTAVPFLARHKHLRRAVRMPDKFFCAAVCRF